MNEIENNKWDKNFPCPYEPCDRCPMLCKKEGSVTPPMHYSDRSVDSEEIKFNPDSKSHNLI